MRFLSISDDSPTALHSETVGELTTPVYHLANGCFVEVFPVSRIASQANVRPEQTSAIYGQSVHEHLGNYDQQSRSLRTCQGSLALMEDDSSTEFLVTFPPAGMMRNGKLYRLSTLGPRTFVRESGLSVPPWHTPVADDSVDRVNGKINSRGEPKLSVQVLWPTPRAKEDNDYQRDRGQIGKERLTLTGAAKMWPTPHGFSKDGKSNGPSGNELGNAVNRSLWPTPTAMNDTGGPALCKWGGSRSREKLKSMTTPEELNGSLNPEFVEWLMGYPFGWTDLKVLVTPLSLKSPK